MKKIKTFIPLVCFLLLVTFLVIEIVSYHQTALAAEEHSEKAAGNVQRNHGEAHAEHHAPPLSYYLYWIILIICLGRAVKFLKAHNDEIKAQNLQRLAELAGQKSDQHENAVHAVIHEVQHDAQHEEDAHGGGHHPHPSILDKFLVTLVVIMFIMEQNPTLAEYHEPNMVGFCKFLLKAGLGVSLMTYGILGMGEH